MRPIERPLIDDIAAHHVNGAIFHVCGRQRRTIRHHPLSREERLQTSVRDSPRPPWVLLGGRDCRDRIRTGAIEQINGLVDMQRGSQRRSRLQQHHRAGMEAGVVHRGGGMPEDVDRRSIRGAPAPPAAETELHHRRRRLPPRSPGRRSRRSRDRSFGALRCRDAPSDEWLPEFPKVLPWQALPSAPAMTTPRTFNRPSSSTMEARAAAHPRFFRCPSPRSASRFPLSRRPHVFAIEHLDRIVARYHDDDVFAQVEPFLRNNEFGLADPGLR